MFFNRNLDGVSIGSLHNVAKLDASTHSSAEVCEQAVSKQSTISNNFGDIELGACDAQEGQSAYAVAVVNTVADDHPQDQARRKWLPRALILGVCMIYASNFAFGTILLQIAPAPVVSGLRFSLAAVALLPWLRKLDRNLLKPGFYIGVLLALAYLGQTIALQTVAAGKVCFISALSVLVCPCLEVVFDGRKMSARLVASALVALMGIALLELDALSQGVLPGWGELWAGLQPLCFGVGYWLTAKALREHPGQELPLTAMQTAVVGSLAVGWMMVSSAIDGTLSDGALLAPILDSPGAIGALVFTGIVSTAIGRIGESRALASISSSEAAVLFTTEPLWAALFAFLLIGQTLAPSAWSGGALILLACVFCASELSLPRPRSLLPCCFGDDSSAADTADASAGAGHSALERLFVRARS